MAYSNSASGMVRDYATLRTVPAMLTVLFALASLFQFGGINQPTFDWIGYTLTVEHSVWLSIGTFLVAFASSETKRFEAYEDWEKVLIAASPGMIVSHHYVAEVNNFVTNNSPEMAIIAFVVTVAGWGVAIR